MSVINAIVIGAIFGISYFFPVSESGHLCLYSRLFAVDYIPTEHGFFELLLRLAVICAVVIVYWQDFEQMINECSFVLGGKNTGNTQDSRLPGFRQLIFILAGVIPLFFVLPFRRYLVPLCEMSVFVGAMLIINGIVLYCSCRIDAGKKNEKNINLWDALLIGFCQSIALIPGLSQTGVALSAGIATGLNRNFSLKYAFLLSVPTLLITDIFKLADAINAGINSALVPQYLVGTVSAFIFGIFSLTVVKKVLENNRYHIVSYYCMVLGVLSIILTLIF